VWLWYGFGVALVWLSVGYQLALVWLWCGFGVALGGFVWLDILGRPSGGHWQEFKELTRSNGLNLA
jgi:hypothetical protein